MDPGVRIISLTFFQLASHLGNDKGDAIFPIIKTCQLGKQDFEMCESSHCGWLFQQRHGGEGHAPINAETLMEMLKVE